MTLFFWYFMTINWDGTLCKILIKKKYEEKKILHSIENFFSEIIQASLSQEKFCFKLGSIAPKIVPHIKPYTTKSWTSSLDTAWASRTWMQLSQVVSKSIGYFILFCSLIPVLNQTSKFSGSYAIHQWSNKRLIW